MQALPTVEHQESDTEYTQGLDDQRGYTQPRS